MNTNHELDRIVQDWLDDRVVAPQLDGLHESLSLISTTPQARARYLGRWFNRGGGDRRRVDADGRPPPTTRRSRLLLTVTGVATALAGLALAANTLPTGETRPAVFEASGATHTVAADGSGTYTTIAQAVAAASNGDEISVAPGTYAETLMLDKNVAITGGGSPGAVVLGGTQLEEPYTLADGFDCIETCALLIEKASPRLTNLTFVGPVRAHGGSPSLAGVSFDGVGLAVTDAKLDLRDSTFIGFGLELGSGSDATVEGNTFTDEADIIVWEIADTSRIVGNGLTDGLLLVGHPGEYIIEANTFRGSGNYWDHGGMAIMVGARTGDGIGIRPRIVGNRFEGGRTGIVVDAGTQPLIEGNHFVDLTMAVQIGRSQAVISDNRIVDGAVGVVVVSGGAPTITDNVIDVTGRGIVVGSGSSPAISGNTVCGGDASIHVADSATPDVGENQTCEDDVTG